MVAFSIRGYFDRGFLLMMAMSLALSTEVIVVDQLFN
jgi:hypothetical protein